MVHIEKALKKKVQIAYSVYTIFTGNTSNKKLYSVRKMKFVLNRVVHIDYLTSQALEIKKKIKAILKSPF